MTIVIALVVVVFLKRNSGTGKPKLKLVQPPDEYQPIKVFSSLDGYDDNRMLEFTIELGAKGFDVTYRSIGLASGAFPFFQYTIYAKKGQEFEVYEELTKIVQGK
ncbi:MAG: hypothetical protein KDD25_03100 [Bdellovibrionales bacterium]|nr:hypothetical protein [Bdellovibrionales bacterium]